MKPTDTRAALVAEAGRVIARGSRSFALASRLFDRTTRERAWLLYAWCRHCDDACDNQLDGWEKAAAWPRTPALDRIGAASRAALRGKRTAAPPFEGLRIVASETGLPARLVENHLAGFGMDEAGWRPTTEEELLLYCYRVAGAVGCMMAIVMGVSADDDPLLDHAADLGIAFQLANIARDLGDDHRAGRCYLPKDWLDAAGLDRDSIDRPENRARLAGLARRLVALASRYEASGRAGAIRLPFRSRWAVLSAAGIYGAIGRLVVRRGPAAWGSRAIVRKRRKLFWMTHALSEALLPSRANPGRDGLWTRPR